MGDSGDALAGLAQMFNNPLSYNVLPYKNQYTRDGKIDDYKNSKGSKWVSTLTKEDKKICGIE